jgi:hypothetical protein
VELYQTGPTSRTLNGFSLLLDRSMHVISHAAHGSRTMANWQWMAASYLLLLECIMQGGIVECERGEAGMPGTRLLKPNDPHLTTSRSGPGAGHALAATLHSTPLPIPIVGEYSDGRTRRRPVRSRSLPGLARRRRLTATRSIRMCAAGRP